MFYILLVVEGILIGASFFLLYQLNQEGLEATGGGVSIKEKATRTPKPARAPKPKKEKKKRFKKGKSVEEDIEEDISWENFGIVERDKGAMEEQREMDEMFGFESNKSDGLLERAKSTENAPKKNLSIEEQFGDLFSDDEKNEISDSFEPTPLSNRTSGTNSGIDDFSDFENFKLGDDDSSSKVTNSTDDDAYDFLKNYDFDSDDKESIDDDIFDRARNQKSSEQQKSVSPSNDNWDFETIKDDFPPIEGVNYNNNQNQGVELNPSSGGQGMDEDDDIFARLQRLSNMMDQQKK